VVGLLYQDQKGNKSTEFKTLCLENIFSISVHVLITRSSKHPTPAPHGTSPVAIRAAGRVGDSDVESDADQPIPCGTGIDVGG
jgi:hypothetical protein